MSTAFAASTGRPRGAPPASCVARPRPVSWVNKSLLLYTVNASDYRGSDFPLTSGPSYRQIIDVDNWDNTVAVNTPGQSGDPNSPHDRDLFELWRTGQYFSLSFGGDAVQANTESYVLLTPRP